MGKDFENPWGITTPKGEVKMMSALLDSAVFPGTQGGPLEHVIAAKAVAFGEALDDSFKDYQLQVKKNAAAMAQAFMDKGYKVVSGGTDNHSLLIDLRTKFPDLTGSHFISFIHKSLRQDVYKRQVLYMATNPLGRSVSLIYGLISGCAMFQRLLKSVGRPKIRYSVLVLYLFSMYRIP